MMNPFAKLSLQVLLPALMLVSTSAQARLTCVDAFANAPASQNSLSRDTRLGSVASTGRDLKLWIAQLRSPVFRVEKFNAALETLRNTPASSWSKPKSREASLALVHVLGEQKPEGKAEVSKLVGRSNVSRAELKAIAQKIGPLNPAQGISGEQLRRVYTKIYELDHALPADHRLALLQWTDKEIGSNSLIEAADHLGILQDPNARLSLMTALKKSPQVISTINRSALGLLNFLLTGNFPKVPTYSRLARTRLSPELQALVQRDGFDASYPLLKKHYGHLANFDSKFRTVSRVAKTALLGGLMMLAYPVAMRAALPPEYPAGDHGSIQLTKDVVDYYSKEAVRIYHEDFRGEKIAVDPSLVPTSAISIDATAPISLDPEPVPVASANSTADKDTVSSTAANADTETAFDQSISASSSIPQTAEQTRDIDKLTRDLQNLVSEEDTD